MRFTGTHRGWITLLTIAVGLMLCREPALHYAGDKVASNLAEIKAEKAKTEQNLRQLQDDVATARKLGSQMDLARAAQVLAPVDRLKIAAMLEKEAARNISHFSYTLAPEEKVSINSGGSAQSLALCNINLAGEAPTDQHIAQFLEQVRTQLPGRARIQHLIITRIGGAEAPLSINNVHFEVVLEWLSNGAVQTVAGGL